MVEAVRQGEALGKYGPVVESALRELDSQEVIARIWGGDHLVWDDDPTEISDRLGWLDLPATMRENIPLLESFAAEICGSGYRHVVLLGMGGSSLGPEVLRRTFASKKGYPELLVLDSTLPSWIRAVDKTIDPARTLFLVSSKSGTTIEPNTLYSYYRQRVADAVGESRAGGHFTAVTDPGTALTSLAAEQGFRRVFANPPEIGGRYSVLSCFGLVPAALMGLDLEDLLASADVMRDACRNGEAASNPGARLGAIMASLAQEGRDKLTLVTSPGLAGFGLWVEQLLAESLGKNGKGIIPVAGEPPLPDSGYGSDRLVVEMRLEGDRNTAPDVLSHRLAAEHPTIVLELGSRTDLGAEFYRWEFATAVAGHILGVHPFDQPDVQGAKDMTDLVLEQYLSGGSLPAVAAAESMEDLLAEASRGDYLAILAYLEDTPEISIELDNLRHRVSERYGIPTTAGFGPRYLHSTGQLHKGGPGTGLFLQLTAGHGEEIRIPGRPFSFGVLADAQAAGDLMALQALGRRTIRIHVGNEPAAAIERMASGL